MTLTQKPTSYDKTMKRSGERIPGSRNRARTKAPSDKRPVLRRKLRHKR